MHHLHILSSKTPLVSPSLHHCFFNYEKPPLLLARTSRSSYKWRVLALERERDQSKFEVDPDKARRALDELDQQLESLSIKQVNPPKIKASSLSDLKEDVKFESSEISGSFLSFIAFGLFVFSIFYNIIFLTVIKPAIDIPEDIVATNVATSEITAEFLQNQ